MFLLCIFKMQPISQKICKYNVFSPKICKYVVFSPEIRKYGIFVAKICKNALIDSFEGFAVVIDNSASYAGLFVIEFSTPFNPSCSVSSKLHFVPKLN